MRTVYTTRFETVQAFSTARKALESLIGSGKADVTEYAKVKPGAQYEEKLVEVTEANIPRLIAFLNKKGSILVQHGGHDATRVDKVQVQ